MSNTAPPFFQKENSIDNFTDKHNSQDIDSESTKLAATWCSNILQIFNWCDEPPPEISELMCALDDSEQMQNLNNVIDTLLRSKSINIASTKKSLELLNALKQSTKELQTKYQSTLIDSQKQLKQHKAYIDCEEI